MDSVRIKLDGEPEPMKHRSMIAAPLAGVKKRVHDIKLRAKPAAASRVVQLGPEHNDFTDNVVITSRYTPLSFPVLFLFEAFSKFANVYFLVVAVLQTIPAVSITDGVPFTAIPLTIVLVVEALFAANEDLQRHKDDNSANTHACLVVRDGICRTVEWRDVKVGDVCKIRNREPIPADCLVLAASDTPPQAVCFVETKSLDGETNLKLRQGFVELAEQIHVLRVDAENVRLAGAAGQDPFDRAVCSLRGEVLCETPNPYLDKFTGTCKIGPDEASASRPIDVKNILLRGCTVRSTDFVYGLVLNTGHDTKIMQSMIRSRTKVSTLDRTINRMLATFVLVELTLCVLGAGLSKWWVDDVKWDDVFVPDSYTAQYFIIRGFTFFLLVANMIPISLYVSIKVIRVCQSLFVYWDVEMRNEGLDPHSKEKFMHPAKMRSIDLVDSLGQISFVFSDKTGTLTNNVMEFRKLAVNGVAYGSGSTVIGIAALTRDGHLAEAASAKLALEENERAPHPRFVNFEDGNFSQVLGEAKVRDFLTCLAVCHEVLLENVRDDEGKETGEQRLSASSPDDQALVVAAAQMGFRFAGRANGGRTVQVEMGAPGKYISDRRAFAQAVAGGGADPDAPAPPGRMATFDMLETLEFTSTRKRMSVLVRDTSSGAIRVMCKGADSEIFKRLAPSQRDSAQAKATSDHITRFADDGLRTLTVACKTLDEATYSEWSARYRRATTDLAEMEKRKSKEDNAIDALMDEIEANLELMGATAIEDKLQEQVPDTIRSLAEAGLKLWVLTGDKQETAINIAWACQLLDHSMRTIVINTDSAQTPEEIRLVLAGHVDSMQIPLNPNHIREDVGERIALVIDGAALGLCYDEDYPDNKVLLLRLACRCVAVVACRVSPKQKGQVVQMVREGLSDAKTLAIGDGANDVGMIQAAHVGVGVSGLEGMQAVNAADVAVGRFRFLKRLLLVHGRNNYRRTAKLVLLILYKNIFMVITQIIYSHANGFSGQKFYFQLGVEAFNLLFTNAPVLLLGVYDKDIPDRYLLQFPQLYEIGLNSMLFNAKTFFQWVVNAFWQAIVVYAAAYFCYMNVREMDLWLMGTLCFTVVCFISNSRIALEQGSWHWSNWAGWVFTILLWPFAALVFGQSSTKSFRYGWEFQDVFINVVKRPDTWAIWTLVFVVALARDYTWKAAKREFWPESRHILQEHAKLSGLPFEYRGPVDFHMEDMTPLVSPAKVAAGEEP